MRVRFPHAPQEDHGSPHGDVAQLGERCFRTAEAAGSIPAISTKPSHGPQPTRGHGLRPV